MPFATTDPRAEPAGMRPKALLEFLRLHRLAVQASVSAIGGAQAAIVGFAVTDQFEIDFDTLDSTRRAEDLVLSMWPGAHCPAIGTPTKIGLQRARLLRSTSSSPARRGFVARVGTDYV